MVELKVRKFSLQGSKKMYVEQAATWSRELTRMRARGPGDTENAMRSLEDVYGISYGTTWKLRYRLSQVKDIGVETYAKIKAAYYAECANQRHKLALQIENRQAIARAVSNPVVEVLPVSEGE
jgi:hypothetical protein